MAHNVLIICGDCVLASGTLAILLFTVLFGIRSNWSKSAAGRSQFYLAASCSMILVLVAYSRLATSYGWPFPAQDWIRLIAYGIVSTALWRMLATFAQLPADVA